MDYKYQPSSSSFSKWSWCGDLIRWQGKEGFWRTKCGDDTVTFLCLYVYAGKSVPVFPSCLLRPSDNSFNVTDFISGNFPLCHLPSYLWGRRLAKGQVSTGSLLICRMKLWAGESLSTSGEQQAKPRLLPVYQVDLVGSFYVAVGACIILCLPEIWYCMRHKSWIIMFEEVPWKWKQFWLNNKWTLIWENNQLFLCFVISSSILIHFQCLLSGALS